MGIDLSAELEALGGEWETADEPYKGSKNKNIMELVKTNGFGKEIKWDCDGISPWFRSKLLEGGFGTDRVFAKLFFVGEKGHDEKLINDNIGHLSCIIRSIISGFKKRKWTKKRGNSIELLDIGKSKKVYCLSKFVDKIEEKFIDQQSINFDMDPSPVSQVKKGITWWSKGEYHLISTMPLNWVAAVMNTLNTIYKNNFKHVLYSGYTVEETLIALEKRRLEAR